ncbi:MAG: DNA primase [Candidatus Nealsonbacteria bacterium CG02_land_8_20_14_3_00_37_10]|uniref:DNA primase n=1 Tax=Candidatus Nealsonbacteria bacterium CG02_land_8_20_14_3_00_37_10 TaxID=1974699 RepID=A0A2M7D9J9_9BACT|nr:MAG: DNA primase [Candidatus Nealsonbacteria bacterium CG02_land_8_20_14_3_00_37_10]
MSDFSNMLNSPVDEIKNRLDIVEVIGSYIKLQKTGINYRAVCPFHSEKKPSFFVSPSRQIWHCFGCGKGGDIFGFVKEIEGVEFGDALRILAQRAGVELKRQTPEYKQWQTERQRLHEICELAARFFEKQLEESKTGKEAKKYLISRGIEEESIKKWKIGYAPDVWQGLADFLSSRSYQQEEIKKAGLGLSSEKGSFYDRFRGRIIFPIFDLNSQVVGFGGRVFKDKDNKEIAKYVNTPQTMLYDKGRILYGLDKAKVEIRKKDFCILVEGYTDVIMAHQAGTQNVVATSGTALTPFQLKILKRYTENLILGFDMDIAGDTATKRGIDLAQTLGFNIKVLRLPKGKDAAEIISKDKKEWEEALSRPKSIMDFYFESAFLGRDEESPEEKKEISKILLPVIKRIPNRIVQAHWINELAKKLRVKEEDVEEELKKVKLEGYPGILGIEPEEIKNLAVKSREELLEEKLVTLILKSPQNIDIVKKEDLEKFSGPVKEILIKLKENAKIDSDFFNYPSAAKGEEESKALFDYLALRADIEEIEEKEIAPEIQCCLKEILIIEIKDKLGRISQEIKKAEEEKNWKKVEELTKEFNQLTKSR